MFSRIVYHLEISRKRRETAEACIVFPIGGILCEKTCVNVEEVKSKIGTTADLKYTMLISFEHALVSNWYDPPLQCFLEQVHVANSDLSWNSYFLFCR